MSLKILARNLFKTYRDGGRQVPVLGGIDLEVAAGEMVAVVGPSGSGKSTLLHLLGGLDRPDPEPLGEVILGDQSLSQLGDGALAAFRNRTLGFVFQFHQLLPDFTALENVMLPGRIAGHEPAEVHGAARKLLQEVGLEDRLEHFPNELSGGERQRVALCRALALEPPILLADEPTGNLDPSSGEKVLELLEALRRRRGTTVVLVTHNPDVARRCAKLYTLDRGVLHASPP